MSNIRARRRKDGSVGYTARVRIRVKGRVVHQEIQTFSTKAVGQWAKRREVELEDPTELDKARQGETTLASVIRWYIDCFKNVSLWQRSKQSALLFLERHEIGTVDILSLTTQWLVEHVRARRASGVSGSTAANDLILISLVLEAAKAARNLPVNLLQTRAKFRGPLSSLLASVWGGSSAPVPHPGGTLEFLLHVCPHVQEGHPADHNEDDPALLLADLLVCVVHVFLPRQHAAKRVTASPVDSDHSDRRGGASKRAT
jgi:hypothetical protein